MDNDVITLPELPFELVASHPGVWRRDDGGAVLANAPGHTDFYVNPGGDDSGDAESLLNAAMLLGVPPAGDFQVSARVTVDFRSQYDAGVLLLWIDERQWAKFGRVYAYHASTDNATWQLIRVFTMGDDLSAHRIGFEAQSPTGDGCTVTFTDIRFSTERLADLRDGS